MVTSVVIGIIIFIIALVIYREYRNEKKYKEEQRHKEERKERKLSPKVTKRPAATRTPETKEVNSETPGSSRPKPAHLQQERTPQQPIKEEKPVESRATTPKPAHLREEESAVAKQAEKPKAPTVPKKETPKRTEIPKAEEPGKTEKPSVKEEISADLPKGEYPEFNYERLIEMGLSEEEAHEFIQELIPQIGEQIPLIDEALKIPDFHKMERLTHSIKGSSTTIGTGGVSDLLVEYNTYLKTGDEVPVAEAYQAHLKHYFEKLKKQFPAKD